MNLLEKKINLSEWISENTKNSKTVVELGAGLFNRLKDVHSSVPIKIGIEIWKPYIDRAIYHDCIKIHGNLKLYRKLLDGYELNTVMLIDILEHFEKKEAFKLINNLKQDFNKIILMLPSGKYEQEEDCYNLGADDFQKHRSFWYDEDLEKLEFTENIIDSFFHNINGNRQKLGLPTSCYFLAWNKF